MISASNTFLICSGIISTLTSLNLSYNQIGYKGIKALAAALGENYTLFELDFSDNEPLNPIDFEEEIKQHLNINKRKGLTDLVKLDKKRVHKDISKSDLVKRYSDMISHRYLSLSNVGIGSLDVQAIAKNSEGGSDDY